MNRVPEFWEWLVHQGWHGVIKIPKEIYDEIKVGKDELAVWIKKSTTKPALVLEEEPDPLLVTRAVDEGYAEDLTGDELDRIGQDPFLIAYALRDLTAHCIVTTEASKPARRRANRHLPDVARSFGIRTCTPFAMVRELDFSTAWRRRQAPP